MQYMVIATERVPTRSRGAAVTSRADACVLFTSKTLRLAGVYATTQHLGNACTRRIWPGLRVRVGSEFPQQNKEVVYAAPLLLIQIRRKPLSKNSTCA